MNSDQFNEMLDLLLKGMVETDEQIRVRMSPVRDLLLRAKPGVRYSDPLSDSCELEVLYRSKLDDIPNLTVYKITGDECDSMYGVQVWDWAKDRPALRQIVVVCDPETPEGDPDMIETIAPDLKELEERPVGQWFKGHPIEGCASQDGEYCLLYRDPTVLVFLLDEGRQSEGVQDWVMIFDRKKSVLVGEGEVDMAGRRSGKGA